MKPYKNSVQRRIEWESKRSINVDHAISICDASQPRSGDKDGVI